MIDDMRMDDYKGVYHHYGHKQLNDAPERQKLLEINLVPPFKHKGIKENQDWALSFARNGKPITYRAIESENSPRYLAAAGRLPVKEK
jgi:hypothetical protein